MSPHPDADLARVRAIALELPEATEKLSHGTQAFFVGKGKAFAYFSHDHHSCGITAVLVKTGGPDEQAMLLESDPGSYYSPPYIGVRGWVGLRLDTGDTDWNHVADLVAGSWELAAPARLLEAGGR